VKANKFVLLGNQAILMTGGILLYSSPSHSNLSRNAIQVKNIGNVQVGHLAKNFAAALAPLMDQQVATVEGVVNAGNCEVFWLFNSICSSVFLPVRGGNHYELPLYDCFITLLPLSTFLLIEHLSSMDRRRIDLELNNLCGLLLPGKVIIPN
jgi:hypothetical protein